MAIELIDNSTIKTSVNDNAYKDRQPLLPPMTYEDTLHKTQNKSSVVTTLPTLPRSIGIEVKVPRSFKIRKSSYDVANRYRKMAGLTWGDFIEDSWFIKMQVDPVDGVMIVVNRGEKVDESDIDQLMLIMECTQELEEMLARLKRTNGQGVKIHKNTLSDLRKVFSKCRKVKNKPSSMEDMIVEAMNIVGF